MHCKAAPHYTPFNPAICCRTLMISAALFSANFKVRLLCSFRILKAHWQISKKLCSEKCCSCDEACQFSALYGTPWRSYLEKTDKWRQMYKQTSLTFYISNDVCKGCWEGKIVMALMRLTSLWNGCLITFKKCTHKSEKN